MKLTYITFTGIDEHTDLSRVKYLSERYPYVEFGVLLSYNWKDNGHRFPNPRICEALAELDIGHLSAHLCGQAAIDVAKGDDSASIALGGGYFFIFSRCQLNLCARGMFDDLRKVLPPLFLQGGYRPDEHTETMPPISFRWKSGKNVISFGCFGWTGY